MSQPLPRSFQPDEPARPGQVRIRVDGPDKVTGAARYTADVPIPGALVGRSLRSPYPHARIVALDASAARTMPGVHAVLTGPDIPDRWQGRSIFDMPVLAQGTVRFAGQKVAAVAAETEEQADAALEAIVVEYEELPLLDTVEAALAPDAPVLHPDFAQYRHAHQLPRSHPNEAGTFSFGKGDPDPILAAAPRTWEHHFSTQVIHHVYLEAHACAAAIEPDGRVRLWSTNKNLFPFRALLAQMLDCQPEDLLLENLLVGGDFGGKGAVMDEVLCVELARASGRPVRMVMSWVEEFQAANPRHASTVTIRTAVDPATGRMLARDGIITFPSGGYSGFKPWGFLLLPGFMEMAGPYDLEASRATGRSVYTTTVPGGHMRAPGSIQSVFAGEHQVDLIARDLGLDPLEFRRRNLVTEDGIGTIGRPWTSVAVAPLLEIAATRRDAWRQAPVPDGLLRGIGIACSERHTGGGRAEVTLRLLPDGRLEATTGTTETGTGALTMLAQVIAADWGLPPDAVTIQRSGTLDGPWDDGSGGSRVTHVTGRAGQEAGEQLRTRLATLAADLLEAPAEAVRWDPEQQLLAVPEAPDRNLTLADLAGRLGARLEEATVRAEYHRGQVEEQAWAVHLAEVHVDPETGTVRPTRYLAIHDVGTAINPQLATGQIEGGMVTGLGQALCEELVIEGGIVTTPSHADYKVPTLADVPALEVVLYEGTASPGPWNAKAIAEICTQPVPAAIANAVLDATGISCRDLPIRAWDLREALRAQA